METDERVVFVLKRPPREYDRLGHSINYRLHEGGAAELSDLSTFIFKRHSHILSSTFLQIRSLPCDVDLECWTENGIAVLVGSVTGPTPLSLTKARRACGKIVQEANKVISRYPHATLNFFYWQRAKISAKVISIKRPVKQHRRRRPRA